MNSSISKKEKKKGDGFLYNLQKLVYKLIKVRI